MSQLATIRNNLPNIETEADNLLATTQGHEKLLKFVKGTYKITDDIVPLGTEFVAHATQLTFSWIKFVDGKVVDHKRGRTARRPACRVDSAAAGLRCRSRAPPVGGQRRPLGLPATGLAPREPRRPRRQPRGDGQPARGEVRAPHP